MILNVFHMVSSLLRSVSVQFPFGSHDIAFGINVSAYHNIVRQLDRLLAGILLLFRSSHLFTVIMTMRMPNPGIM